MSVARVFEFEFDPFLSAEERAAHNAARKRLAEAYQRVETLLRADLAVVAKAANAPSLTREANVALTNLEASALWAAQALRDKGT